MARRRAMDVDVENRVISIAKYAIDTGATVREMASMFGVSKSTVYKDLTERLPKINTFLGNEVMCVLLKNKKERHLRGGEATRQKYLNAK